MTELTADMAARALIAAARTYDFDVLQVFVPHKPNASRVRSLAAAGCATALGGRRQDYARVFRIHPSELSKAEALAGRGLADLIEMLRWNAKTAQAAPIANATPDKIAPPPHAEGGGAEVQTQAGAAAQTGSGAPPADRPTGPRRAEPEARGRQPRRRDDRRRRAAGTGSRGRSPGQGDVGRRGLAHGGGDRGPNRVARAGQR